MYRGEGEGGSLCGVVCCYTYVHLNVICDSLVCE